jgi:hypothetical protein
MYYVQADDIYKLTLRKHTNKLGCVKSFVVKMSKI